jgi:acetyl-CoA C-acetyltransferase
VERTEAMEKLREVVILSGARTAVGRFGGIFRDVLANQLAIPVVEAVIAAAGVNKEDIGDVILGNCIQRSDEPNLARVVGLKAGIPFTTPAYTLTRQCASGMQAVASAAMGIMCGQYDVALAGGAESMSSGPYVLKTARWGQRLQSGEMTDAVWETLYDPVPGMMMGETAEVLAEEFGITREDQDELALTSNRRASAAREDGTFAQEIVPIILPQKKGDPKTLDRDEHPRADASMEALGKLPPIFKKGGTVTAGNASGMNDGAAMLVIAAADWADKKGLKPIARFVDSTVAGVEPERMGFGPVPAIRNLMARNNMTLADIDLFELNEAFAAQYIACERALGLDREITNVHGSGVALGHPVGCTGARIIVTLVNELRRRDAKRGVASLCVGGGMGIASLIETV